MASLDETDRASRRGRPAVGCLVLVAIAVATIGLWQLPLGGLLLWPFTILSTWYHEMGHGLTALTLGCEFQRLEVFANGSGLATIRGEPALGRVGRALIAAGGPVAPSLVGGGLILASTHPRQARWCLAGLGVLLAFSLLVWVRSFAAWLVLLPLSVLTLWVAGNGSPRMQMLLLQFLGVQACIALYQDIGYFFSGKATVGGEVHHSDTAAIAEALWLPYWFWAVLLTGISVAALFGSLRAAYGPTSLRMGRRLRL